MLVNLSFVVAEARGKLEDKIYCRNQGGAYIRSFVPPTYTNTTYQQTVRNEFKRLSKKWATLTEAERQSWISGAPNFQRTNVFGNKKTLDGKALYQSLNMNLFLIRKTDIVICPAPQFVPFTKISSLTLKANSLVTINTNRAANMAALYESTGNLSPAINFFTKYFKLLAARIPGETGNPALVGQFRTRYGQPQTGYKIAVRVTTIHPQTGQRSAPSIMAGIVQP